MKEALTERECKVVFLIAKGLHNDEIAQLLHISISTVKAHLESIYLKLDVKSRVQAALKALYLGVFELKDAIDLN